MMSHREGGLCFTTELAIGNKIVEEMNTWSLDLAESITEQPATNLHLHTYINLESRFTRLVPVTSTLIMLWIFIVNPQVVRLCCIATNTSPAADR